MDVSKKLRDLCHFVHDVFYKSQCRVWEDVISVQTYFTCGCDNGWKFYPLEIQEIIVKKIARKRYPFLISHRQHMSCQYEYDIEDSLRSSCWDLRDLFPYANADFKPFWNALTWNYPKWRDMNMEKKFRSISCGRWLSRLIILSLSKYTTARMYWERADQIL